MSRLSPIVLVVDDFRDGRELVVEILEEAGLRTEQASDGKEALEKAFTLRPEVILMDLSLPGIDGWEITRRLRGDPRTRSIQIVALTAHATRDPLARAHEVGCDQVLTKPCRPDVLVDVVKRWLAEALARDPEPIT